MTTRIAANARRATGDGGRKRDNSSRSPAIVRIRKASHHVTTSCTLAPVAQRALPAVQQSAPSVSVNVNSARLPAKHVDGRREQHEAPGDEQPGGDRGRAADHGDRAEAGQQRSARRPTSRRSRPRARARSRRRRSRRSSAARAAPTRSPRRPERSSRAARARRRRRRRGATKPRISSGRRASGGIGVCGGRSQRARRRARSRGRQRKRLQPKCVRATPVILSGVHGGSHTSCTSMVVPSGTMARIASRA